MLDAEVSAFFVFLGQIRLELEDVRFIESGLVVQEILAGLEVAAELNLSESKLVVQLLVPTAHLRYFLFVLLDSDLQHTHLVLNLVPFLGLCVQHFFQPQYFLLLVISAFHLQPIQLLLQTGYLPRLLFQFPLQSLAFVQLLNVLLSQRLHLLLHVQQLL